MAKGQQRSTKETKKPKQESGQKKLSAYQQSKQSPTQK